ncbi:hypothetical protein ACA910_010136 [Epithemia clementina (nom. ined.)]
MEWILVGHEPQAPVWVQELVASTSSTSSTSSSTTPFLVHYYTFVSLDLTQWRDDNDDYDWMDRVDDIIVSLRPPLVSSKSLEQAWHFNQALLQGLHSLLQRVVVRRNGQCSLSQQRPQLQRLVHISSVAAIRHVQQHVLRSETDHNNNIINNERDPHSWELDNPYDRFKRATEEMVLELAKATTQTAENATNAALEPQPPRLQVTNLRLGAIFSDDAHCIQCRALAWQARVGCYLPTRIDCNSSRNVAVLMHQLLFVDDDSNDDSNDDNQVVPTASWRPIYYYTRPTQYVQPVPYGTYLVAYRQAYGITKAAIWIPVGLVRWFVAVVHWMTGQLQRPGCTWLRQWADTLFCWSHTDYLLQVTVHEHSFDLTAIQTDVPTLARHEETIVACFQRRKRQLEEQQQQQRQQAGRFGFLPWWSSSKWGKMS